MKSLALGFFFGGSGFFVETDELDLAALSCFLFQFAYSWGGNADLYGLAVLAFPDDFDGKYVSASVKSR